MSPAATGPDRIPGRAAETAETADAGLFGPESVTWQLHADPIMWIAGVRALYLQALHPLAVRAVLHNSDFRQDPWGRLLRTAGFVATVTYGTTDRAERAGARVRGVHRKLRAPHPDTGEDYRLDRPDLLLWVHCAEVASYLQTARRAGYPLTDAQADTYLDEQRTAARLVGLDPAHVPCDRAALRTCFRRFRPRLARTPDSDEVLAFLLAPPVRPLLTLPRALLWRHVAHLTYSSLPAHAHALYRRRPLTPPARPRPSPAFPDADGARMPRSRRRGGGCPYPGRAPCTR